MTNATKLSFSGSRNRKTLFSSLVMALGSIAVSAQASAYEIDENATMADSPASLIGINHIGLSVTDLDEALDFYLAATEFEVIRREVVKDSNAADKLYGHKGIEYEVAVLEAPNMLFELREFSHNRGKTGTKMPAIGPGMTHTCFQSPEAMSGYTKFKNAGADILSRGDYAVDLLGQGVTYAYAYDPDGNMIELEQLDFERLGRDPRDPSWIENGHDLWMTQVALVTHDIERLTDYYATIMGFNPYRASDISGRPTFDEVVDIDDVGIKATWFRMTESNKTMEFWEYTNPVTPALAGDRDSTDLGYTYSIEVGDIHAEYARMKDLGVKFISAPVFTGPFWEVYANDIDGNVFSLRQAGDPNSPYSVPQLER